MKIFMDQMYKYYMYKYNNSLICSVEKRNDLYVFALNCTIPKKRVYAQNKTQKKPKLQ